MSLSVRSIDPRLEITGRKVGKRQQEIAEIAFGIDAQDGNAVQRGLLQKREAQAGFATARHADADAMSGEVARLIVDGFV